MSDETNDSGLTQKEWRTRVDECCQQEFGVGAEDVLGDYKSWTAWHEDVSPEEFWDDDLRFDVEAEASSIADEEDW